MWLLAIHQEAVSCVYSGKPGKMVSIYWVSPLVVFGVWRVNSLVPGRSEWDSQNVIFKIVLLVGIFRSSHDNALWWMPQYLTDDKSTLVQVMAWCRQATSHYLSQCSLEVLCHLIASLGHNELISWLYVASFTYEATSGLNSSDLAIRWTGSAGLEMGRNLLINSLAPGRFDQNF